MTSELENFTTCDLLKTFDKIGEHLSKAAPDKMKEITAKYGGADMAKREVAKEAKDYDPNEKTPKTTVEETKKPGETSVSEDKNAKVEKDFPQGGGGDEGGGDVNSPGTQADVLTQILEAIQDLKAMLAQMGGQNGQEPQPTPNEMRMGSEKTEEEKEKDKEKGEVEKDAVSSAASSEKQIASIVVKALEDKFKELGITKTTKPSENSGHPIEKAEPMDMTKLAKMSWNEVHAYNDKTRPKSFYERAYGQ